MRNVRQLFLLGVIAAPAWAQDTTTARELPAVVTVTRQAPRSPFDLPFGISVVSPDSSRPGQPHVAADQTLMLIPGLTVSNRSNPSQDVRVSVRGFGARSAFGVRSVRVIRDGMPLTMPDGQTPLDYLDLESVGRIEVIRGTASALYGNASGGIIDIHSVIPVENTTEARVWAGSDNLLRTTAVAARVAGGWTFQGNVGRTTADNARQFSRQRLINAFGRATGSIGGTTIAITGMGLDMPLAENPGALTADQVRTDPGMADPSSITKRARKEVEQLQLGLTLSRGMSWGGLNAAAYGGTRSLYNPLTFAIVGVDRRIAGGSVRADFRLPRISGLQLTAGADVQMQDDARRNWTNCNNVVSPGSCPFPGEERGTPSIDQRELVVGGGPYARLELERGRLRMNAGLRADAIRFELEDRFQADGDDSGDRTLRAISPMAGLTWRAHRLASLYANYTTAFETPTTTELGNQADGSAGLNRDLRPQQSRTFEVGAKGIAGAAGFELSAFHTRVRDELIPFQASNDRTYYRNAGVTRRVGAELSSEWSPGWADITAAYSYSRFRFVDFAPGGGQLKGNRIPGIPEHQAQLSALRRIGPGFIVGEALHRSRVWANDANSAAASPFEVVNIRTGLDVDIGRVRFSPMIGLNNAFDRQYVGSVAINAAPAAAKFYEPSPGRAWITGARVVF